MDLSEESSELIKCLKDEVVKYIELVEKFIIEAHNE